MIAIILFLGAIFFYLTDKKNISLLLFFSLPTSGFQIVPFSLMVLPDVGLNKTYDLGIVFLLFILALEYKKIIHIVRARYYKALLSIFILSSIIFLVSVVVYKYNVATALRPYRSYLFLLSFALFELYSFKDIEKCFKLLIFITFVQSMLYILQNPLGMPLLNSGLADDIVEHQTASFTRYYNLPVLLIPSLFYCLLFQKKFIPFIRYIYIASFFAVILLSLHRNLLFATILILFFSLLKSSNIKKTITYISVGSLLLLLTYTFLEDRIDEGLKDLQIVNKLQIDNNYGLLNYDAHSTNTSTFRAFHFLERLQYVSDNSMHILFGIGFLTEDAPQAKALHFNVGLKDESGQIAQINTGDIAWSILILNFGIVGTIVYLLCIIWLLVQFFKLFTFGYAKLCACYILLVLITSFYGTDLISVYCKLMLPLLAVLSRKEIAYYISRKKSYENTTTHIHHNTLLQPS